MKRLLFVFAFLGTSVWAQYQSPYYPTQGGGTGTGPNSSFVTSAPTPTPLVSASSPLYVEFTQRDDVQNLYVLYSQDATNYYSGGASPITPLTNAAGATYHLRDPAVTHTAPGQPWWIYGTIGASSNFTSYSSSNLQTWNSVVNVPVTGSPSIVWRPSPFQDPVSQNWYMFVSTCTGACATGATGFQVAQFNPTTQVYQTFNNVTLNSDGTNQALFDFRVYYNASNTTYYALYVSEQTGGPQYIHIATASSVTGPYTRINTGTTDYFGFGSASENPDMVLLPNGNIRVFADTWATIGGTGRVYSRKYVDTQSNFGTVVGTPARLGGPEQEAGSNITITSQADANQIFTAVNLLTNGPNQVMSPLDIDGPGYDPFSLAIWVPALVPGQTISAFSTGTPSIGMQNPIDGSWSTLGPVNQANGQGFSIVGGIGGGAATLMLDANANQGANKWAFQSNSGGAQQLSITDFTHTFIPFAWVTAATTPWNALMQAGANSQYCWSSNAQFASATGACDTGISRTAANTVAFGNGAQGNATAKVSYALFLPGVIYSAAGTPLPSCAAGITGQEAVVSDATSPTFLGTYTSGGGVKAPVLCNGTSWVTY